MRKPAQGAVDLVLGVLADAAGVEEDRVGLAGVVGQLVTLRRSWPTTSSLSSTFIWQPTVSMYSLGMGWKCFWVTGMLIRLRRKSMARKVLVAAEFFH